MPRSTPRSSRMVLSAIVLVLASGSIGSANPAAMDGASIYKAQCAWCHGANGEGDKDNYDKPLIGDRSVEQLARVIERTMPEDDPDSCVGEEARAVAAFVHESFYSPVAQARNRPARIELSRLTVAQYRNTVADLIGSFRPPAPGWGEERGLKGEYFKSRSFRGNARAIDRTDPVVKFDFGVKGPDPESFDPNEFSIRWQGSVLATETGDYEFVVRTEHAVRLWVNDNETALIDAWVKSGDETEYRGMIPLLGGRAYPLRLEFSKAKQGVDDKKKNEGKEIPASITLLWKPPAGVVEVIPAHNLAPTMFPTTYVCATPFPPDDRSMGYERGTSISRSWENATTDAAIETAGYIAARLREFTGARPDSDDRAEKYRAFAAKFAERAFRRPLTDIERKEVVDAIFNEVKDPELALKRVLLLTLKTPWFLYREIGETNDDPYAVASRISYELWDAPPDAALLKAAAEDKLRTREQVVAQAERMVDDLRTRAKLRAFFFRWLRADPAPDVSKDPEGFPGFNEDLVADLRTSLDLTLEDLLWSGPADLKRMLLADEIYLNGRLAKYYGFDLPEDAGFQKVRFEPEDRVALLAHPYLMASLAYTSASSPIHRGVFLSRSVLGRSLRPPPIAVAPLAPDLNPGLTTRERVTLQTSPKECQSCHSLVNPLGFALERFDAVGKLRERDKGKTVDAQGSYTLKTGESHTFTGARELARFLAESEEVPAAIVEQLFHHTVKQPMMAFGPDTKAKLTARFVDGKFDIRRLLVEIVAATAHASNGRSDPATARTE